MRVLLVSHNFPPFGLAGVERATEASAVALRQLGHDVAVLTRRPSVAPRAPHIARELQGDLEVFRISGGGSAAGSFPGFHAQLERHFERVLVEWQPDVLVATHLMFHSPLYVALAHAWGIPVAIEMHDFYAACERAHLERPSGALCEGPAGGLACAQHCFRGQPLAELRWSLRTQLFRSALQEAETLICPSLFVADYFAETFRLGRRPTVLGNGVDPPRPFVRVRGAARRGTLRLVSAGVVVPHKGLHVVIEAARMAGLRNAEYTLLGPVTEPYAGELRKLAAGVPGLTLRMYGGFEQAELSQLLGDADALVVPSLVWETFSRVAREAFACGVPVLASRLGALPEAVREGENGHLFDPQRPAELAAILRSLADDPDRLANLRQGIRRTDWITAAERGQRLEAMLRELQAVPVDRVRARTELELRRAIRASSLTSGELSTLTLQSA